MKSFNIEMFPVQQTGSNCKTVAITAIDQHYALKLGYSPIPLHKRYDGAPLLSMRQIAKELGSLQGELLEIGIIIDMLKHIGYDPQILECKDVTTFRKHITESLQNDHPLITFFAVETSGTLYGLPTDYNGTNEHAATIKGYDSNTDKVTIMHWGQYFTCPLVELYQSTQSLPEQREKEFYKSVKSENLVRKYQILTKEEDIKDTYSKKQSIAPRPNTGFKNKLIRLKDFPELKKIIEKRKINLAKEINLNYLIKRIENNISKEKLLTAQKAGNQYKAILKDLISQYLSDSNRDNFEKALIKAGDNYFNAIFSTNEDILINKNRQEKIKNLIQQVHKAILSHLVCEHEEKKQEHQSKDINLYVIEHVSKSVIICNDEILEGDTLETLSNKVRIVPSEFGHPNSFFKELNSLNLAMRIKLFAQFVHCENEITFDLTEDQVFNNEEILSIISCIYYSNSRQKEIGLNEIIALFPKFDNQSNAKLATLKLTIFKNLEFCQERFENFIQSYHKVIQDNKAESEEQKSAFSKIVQDFDLNKMLVLHDINKVSDLLDSFAIELHRILPQHLKSQHSPNITISLKQRNIIGILEGFKEKLVSDYKYPMPKIKQAIVDQLDIEMGGHCRALSGFRSYCIALEKQNNPTVFLSEIIKTVEVREINILQTIDKYRNGQTISAGHHQIINDYIRSIVLPQKHTIHILDGEHRIIPLLHYKSIIDDQDRVFNQVDIKSKGEALFDIESIINELRDRKQSGDYCIYSTFGGHQTFFFLSVKGENCELVYNDPNLPHYIFYDLDDKNFGKNIMKQLHDSHPGNLSCPVPFYVTQLSAPNSAPSDLYNRSDLAWHAELGNESQFSKILNEDKNDYQLSIKEKRDYTPLLCAVVGGHKNIVQIILEQKYVTKTEDIQNAIMVAVENNNLDILKYLVEKSPQSVSKNTLYSLFENPKYKSNEEIISYLLTKGVPA